MQDISLHLLDILENSIRAEAKSIDVYLELNKKTDRLKIKVIDDGHGMDKEMLFNSQDPFFTTKKDRVKKVGLGIPLFKQNALHCAGSFEITSGIGDGTSITAEFRLSHIDRMPLGNIGDTILTSIVGHPETDLSLKMKVVAEKGTAGEFTFNTREIKKELEEVPIHHPDVVSFVKSHLTEEITNLYREEI